jgi:signal transduction histidine kinase/predicted ATPase
MPRITEPEPIAPLDDRGRLWLAARGGDLQERPVLVRFYPWTDAIEAHRLAETDFNASARAAEAEVPRPLAVGTMHNSPCLVMEGYSGVPLAKMASDITSMDSTDRSALMRAVTESLGRLHTLRRIHYAVNPYNILVRYSPGGKWETKISGMAFSRPAHDPAPDLSIPGEIPREDSFYVAPELRNRGAMSGDRRSDLYALGAVFLFILTGRHPEDGEDFSFGDGVGGFSAPLAQICCKLLEKDPDKRYRETAGVLRDLSFFMAPGFSPGKDDPSPFPCPVFLGREKELRVLRECLDASHAGGGSTLYLFGPAGSGKTSLVRNFIATRVPAREAVLFGRFEPGSATPFAGFINAFEDFARKAQTFPEERLEKLKKSIGENFAEEDDGLSAVAPSIAKLAGLGEVFRERETGVRDPRESGHALQQTVLRLLSQISTVFGGGVLFIDDLHFAGAAETELCGILSDSPIPGVLRIFASRRRLDISRGTAVELSLFDAREIRTYISDSFPGLDPRAAERLADLAEERTDGNPLFLGRWIGELYEERIIDFDAVTGTWSFTEPDRPFWPKDTDISVFLDRILGKCGFEERTALAAASCILRPFSPALISKVSGIPVEKAGQALHHLAAQGFIALSGTGDDPPRFRFTHDKLREAASSLLDGPGRADMNLAVVRVLRADTLGRDEPEFRFEIAEHISASLPAIRGEMERREFLLPLFIAAREAKRTGAFETAWRYFSGALELFDDSGWERDYTAALELHREGLETAFLVHKETEREALGGRILKRGKNFYDTLPVYEFRIETHMAKHELKEAADLSLDILDRLGFPGPYRPSPGLWFNMEIFRLKRFRVLPKKPGDPVSDAVLRILIRGFTSLYLSRPEEFPYIFMRTAARLGRDGSSPYLPFGLVLAGMVECGLRGNVGRGYRYGIEALRLVEKPGMSHLRAKVYFIFYFAIHHWKNSLAGAREAMLKGFEAGLRSGDRQYAGLNASTSTIAAIFFGPSLPETDAAVAAVYEKILPLGQARSELTLRRHRQAGFNFLAGGGFPWDLSGPHFVEAKDLPRLEKSSDLSGYYTARMLKILLAVHFNAPKGAVPGVGLDFSWRPHLFSLNPEGMFLWYQALFFLRGIDGSDSGTEEKVRFASGVLKELRRRARRCPADYRHRAFLLFAEIMKIRGHLRRAEKYYRRACSAAERNANYPEKGLVHESFGRYLRSVGKNPEAEVPLKAAREYYALWGASAKVRVLDAEFTYPKERPEKYSISEDSPLEIETLMNAGRDISGEIRMDSLMETILSLLLRHSGADYGHILYAGDDGDRTAEAFINRGGITVVPLPEESPRPDRLREAAANYVRRMAEPVVIRDADKDPLFSSFFEPLNAVRSALCVPILRDGGWAGHVYLKNSWTPGAFTPNRIRMVTLLTAQASVSLENAVFYRVRQNLAEQRERLLKSEKLASLGILTATVAHEINNPNHVIRLNAELLKSTAGRISAATRTAEPKDREFLEILASEIAESARGIGESSERISSIIGELKGVVRDPGDKKNISLNEVVESVLRLSADTLFSSNRRPALEMVHPLPPVKGDFGKLQQVVLNLLENGLQALDDPEKPVIVRTRTEGESVLLEIEDRGCGIPAENLSRVTEPFFSTKREKGGTGLGLYVVAAVAKEHKAKLEIFSRPGEGTRVLLAFPKTP